MKGMNLILLYISQEVIPVFLHRSLSIASEMNPSLHQGTDVEVIALHCHVSGDVLLKKRYHIQNRYIRL